MPASEEKVGGPLLDVLLEQLDCGVAISDPLGRLTLMNSALENMLGKKFKPTTTKTWAKDYQFYDECGTTPLTARDVPLARALAGDRVVGAVITVRCPSHPIRFLRCNATQLFGSDGRVLGAASFVVDITQAITEDRQVESLRTRLVDTVNHELRTPLTSIMGHAELLVDMDLDMPEVARNSLRSIVRAGEKLQDIVETITELTDLEAFTALRTTRVDLARLAREIATEYMAQGMPSDRRLIVSAPCPTFAVVDPDKIQRALVALLDNAVTYSPADSPVNFSVRSDRARVTLSVEDGGQGIEPGDRERLRQPFERGDHPLRPVNSRGLGLAVANTTALAHHGRLVLSENQPRGLRACLEIPLTIQSQP
jgi:signal transduction histidine kinase